MVLLAFVILGSLLIPVLLISLDSVYAHWKLKIELNRLKNLPEAPNTVNVLRNLRQQVRNDKLEEVKEWSDLFDRLSWDTMSKYKKEKLQMDLAVEMTKGLPLKFASKEEPWNPTVSQMNSLGALETTTVRSMTGDVIMEQHTVVPITAASITTTSLDIDRWVQEQMHWKMRTR